MSDRDTIMTELHITGTAGYSMGPVSQWTVLGISPTTEVAYVKSPALAKELVRLTKERDALREALLQIAWEPLGDAPEASAADCLSAATKIAQRALAANAETEQR